MSRLLCFSVLALGACCVLLFAGGFPLMGAEGVYSGGAALVLSLVLGLLCLLGTWKLSAGARLRFLCGMLGCFFCVAGLVAVVLFGKMGVAYARQGGPMWFGAVGMFCMGMVGALFVLIFGFLAYRLMSRRLWLAGAHACIALVLAGAWMDYCGERRTVLTLPADGKTEISSIRLEDGREEALGFALRLDDFQVSHYGTEGYTLYGYGEAWEVLGHPQREGQKLRWGEESWDVGDLRESPGMPQPFLVLPGESPRLLVRDVPPVKDYTARCLLRTEHRGRTEERWEELRVNKPLSCRGWRFYLMNYRPMEEGMLVELQARYSPGRWASLAGMVGLILCTACWCWWKKEESDSSTRS